MNFGIHPSKKISSPEQIHKNPTWTQQIPIFFAVLYSYVDSFVRIWIDSFIKKLLLRALCFWHYGLSVCLLTLWKNSSPVSFVPWAVMNQNERNQMLNVHQQIMLQTYRVTQHIVNWSAINVGCRFFYVLWVPVSKCLMSEGSRPPDVETNWYMWHDQGKQVTCRPCSILSFHFQYNLHLKSYILI